MPNPIPMVLLGRLAIDQAYQSRGLGTALLQDAVLRAQAASRILGVRGLLVHALSEDAKRFYVRNGFVEIMPGAMTLVLSLALSNKASAQT
jgi:GNAT superfamily N-acetyltransferase